MHGTAVTVEAYAIRINERVQCPTCGRLVMKILDPSNPNVRLQHKCWNCGTYVLIGPNMRVVHAQARTG